MSSLPTAACVLNISQPLLTRATINELAGQIASNNMAQNASFVVDCHNLTDVTASGLSALLELRDRFSDRTWILAHAPRSLLRAALQMNLAECFLFCANVAAATDLLHGTNACAR